MAENWLIDIIPVECPNDINDAPENYRKAWEQYVGPTTPENGDRENWLEQAARLEAAVRILPNPTVRVLGRSVKIPNAIDLPHYGERGLHPYIDQLFLESNADRYPRFTGLARYYGRDVELVDCDTDKINRTVRRMLAKHPDDGVFVKFVAKAKSGFDTAYVRPDGKFLDHSNDEFGEKPEWRPFDAFNWLGYGAAMWEGEPDAVLVQQHAAMRYEYRVHIIGGRAVAGAGCVERLTPADNHGDPVHPLMERTRSCGKLEQRDLLAMKYMEFAEQVHESIREEVKGPYCMDLYTGEDGQPHVIELNAYPNCGLYAVDMTTLLEAVRDNPGEFTADEHARELSEKVEEMIEIARDL